MGTVIGGYAVAFAGSKMTNYSRLGKIASLIGGHVIAKKLTDHSKYKQNYHGGPPGHDGPLGQGGPGNTGNLGNTDSSHFCIAFIYIT